MHPIGMTKRWVRMNKTIPMTKRRLLLKAKRTEIERKRERERALAPETDVVLRFDQIDATFNIKAIPAIFVGTLFQQIVCRKTLGGLCTHRPIPDT